MKLKLWRGAYFRIYRNFLRVKTVGVNLKTGKASRKKKRKKNILLRIRKHSGAQRRVPAFTYTNSGHGCYKPYPLFVRLFHFFTIEIRLVKI